jgi:hypothetical protein
MSRPDSSATPYGLRRPTVADARTSVHRVHGPDGASVWRSLMISSGMSGDETAPESLPLLLRTMVSADPVTRLCAEALQIRLDSHTHLSAAHAITRS